MAKEKSTVRDTIINVLLLAAAGGLLVYRYQDCKKKEAERQKQAEIVAQEQDKKQISREQRCLESVKEEDRTACIQCTCRACADVFQACEHDEACRSVNPGATAPSAAPSSSAANMSHRLANMKATCVVQNCYQACLGGK